ncbi:MAG TPA: hypothetical protein VJU13_08665 [Candidatus Nitrosocosmicus sp.]|nr:hypothetical protein [Candidatus Nitrosocosmicus sp.]
MVNDIFEGYRVADSTDEITENIDTKDITRANSNIPDHPESDVTRAIKDSIERNSHIDIRDSETTFKQVFDLAKNAVNEIPTMVNVTGKTINKIVVKSREGIESIHNFKNSLSYTGKDKAE